MVVRLTAGEGKKYKKLFRKLENLIKRGVLLTTHHTLDVAEVDVTTVAADEFCFPAF